MQVESRGTATFVRETIEKGAVFPQTTELNHFNQFTSTDPTLTSEATIKPRERKIDLVFAAIVIGLTASFVAFIFGLVTEYIPRTVDNILLSAFMGICIGVIAYALMKEED
ncbi:MAG: hypothetical protein L0226_16015 [Acidobacteria bacterium]|nr:hypothetical protein [Acidobacteriota bacterium]